MRLVWSDGGAGGELGANQLCCPTLANGSGTSGHCTFYVMWGFLITKVLFIRIYEMTSDFVKLSIKCQCFLRLNRSFVFGRESLPLYLYSYFEKLLLFQMSFLCICRADPQEKRSRTQKMEIDSRPNSRKKCLDKSVILIQRGRYKGA